MKRLFIVSMVLLIVFSLPAQNITISFQPQVTGNQIDTTWVTNQRTYQNVKLIGGESLVLTVIDNLDLYQYGQDGGYLYPNPGYGDATLVFSTTRDQDVTVSVYNISGQELGSVTFCVSRDLGFPLQGVRQNHLSMGFQGEAVSN